MANVQENVILYYKTFYFGKTCAETLKCLILKALNLHLKLLLLGLQKALNLHLKLLLLGLNVQSQKKSIQWKNCFMGTPVPPTCSETLNGATSWHVTRRLFIASESVTLTIRMIRVEYRVHGIRERNVSSGVRSTESVNATRVLSTESVNITPA
jgi:hypothetical protein